ncbi:molybdopterin-dependent oxidoreductase [Pseudomonas chlororaphis]|uniref:molybdopterin-dependent oxidoreductase n=3 Tax=Pseudomonas chlororaphis TaxID=587753 RepID=UPI001B3140C9|nr:molybdopterin-dependent oxidoreductase [Pseudomonas chlororaphis]MBP5059199.1 molybdopterin-dependent oxidoreductase [Pseudomonas chlororaphis]MBP5142947.1 molybdopterin-dependent oxidoreductase [Pseudomonas chlororaphis]QTT98289.1 molybdopterin-dependent oxidoreductase [Pseudomonas chlororaphis]
MHTEKTACILCSRNCGLSVDIEGGKFIKIKGDDEHPTSKGYICQKAARLEHYQNHDDRLKHPLKRQADGSYVQVSWDQALTEIAAKLNDIKSAFGGDAFALCGGAGQGNHLGVLYGQQMLKAMGSRYVYTALAQEKNQDFWLNGRLFGDQTCHTTEDVEHADYVLFIGCNPFQSHGIPNARDTLKEIKKDPKRAMVVIDPRKTETAKQADIHLQLRPGTDAFLLSAILAIIVREGLHDREFLARHCTGFDELEKELLTLPIEAYVRRADVPLEDVFRVARNFANARTACVRIDLGIQQTLHCTLNGYLEKLLYLVTGNFGIKGGNNLHTFLIPLVGNTDERKMLAGKKLKLTAHHKMIPIGGMYPPNILPDEIEFGGIRAVWVDSSNPLMTFADTTAYARAFNQLDLLVVVDIAMTETARMAHYVLPSASQFEKWEAAGFNLEFPENFFQLRKPLFKPYGESLPEPEIYTRLLTKMGLIPDRFPILERIARLEPKATGHRLFLTALAASFSRKKSWGRFGASILYRTLGKALPEGATAGAVFLPLTLQYTTQYREAVLRAGFAGNRFTLAASLLRAILSQRSGLIISKHEIKDVWTLIKNKDRRIHLHIDEMLVELKELQTEAQPATGYPFILMAGERRSYNANQIYRDPGWRKVDKDGAMRMHSSDAQALEIADGERVICQSLAGQIEVTVEVDDSVRLGMLTLPHGYGMSYKGSPPIGPRLNVLTSGTHCDPFSKTPYHKYVPVRILKTGTC